MPRLSQVPRSDTNEEVVTRAYDLMFAEGRDPVADPGTKTGTPGNWWTVFALVPEVLKHAVRGFTVYRHSDRMLDPILRELGQTRAGWILGSQFVFSQHSKSCRGVGMSEEMVLAIPYWQVSDVFTPVQRAVLAYTDALAKDGGRVDDNIFAVLKENLSDETILMLTYIITMYIQHALIARALRLDWDDKPEPCVEIPMPDGDNAHDISADIAFGA